MKYTQFNVIYGNGKTDSFFANSFVEAIVLAMAEAFNNGFSMEIKSVTSDNGVAVTDIKFPTYKFQ